MARELIYIIRRRAEKQEKKPVRRSGFKGKLASAAVVFTLAAPAVSGCTNMSGEQTDNSVSRKTMEKPLILEQKKSAGAEPKVDTLEEEIVKEEVEVTPEILEIRNKQLLESAAKHDKWSVEYYLEKGADIDYRNENGETALLWAASGGNEEMVKFLIEKGADVNSSDNTGKTVLMEAVEYGHFGTVRSLIKNGADVDAKDKKGRKAIDFLSDDTSRIKLALHKAENP